VLARILPGFAFPVLVTLFTADGIADVPLPLSDATLLPIAETEARDVDLGNGNRDEILAFSSDELAVGDVFAKVLPNLTADDIPKARMILINLEAHRANFILALLSGFLAGRSVAHIGYAQRARRNAVEQDGGGWSALLALDLRPHAMLELA
jgi:hypothetical protein